MSRLDKPLRLLLCALLLCATAPLGQARAQLTTDLSNHVVAITTGFAGSSVLIFGTGAEPNDDIVIVVRGPEKNQVVLRKSNVAGIWMNTARITIENVPSFYALASTRPLHEIADEAVLQRHRIGVDQIRDPKLRLKASENLAREWEEAFVRRKQAQGTYSESYYLIQRRSAALFRAEIPIPPNVPVGPYHVETYVFRDGRIVEAQSQPLFIQKVDLEAEVYDFAHTQAGIYGLLAVVMAALAGWLGHLIFKRD